MKEKINLNTFLITIVIGMVGFMWSQNTNDIRSNRTDINQTKVRVGKLETDTEYLKDDIKEIKVKL